MRRALALAALTFGLAAEPVSAGGLVFPEMSDWSGTAVIKAKVPGGTVAGDIDLEVHLGPNAGLMLPSGEFLILADDGMETLELTGDFVLDEKGQPILLIDTTDLATELHDLVLHVCEDVLGLGAECDLLATLDVEVDPTRLKTKAKIKEGSDGVGLSLGAKLPFLLTDGDESVKVSVSIKTSPPAQLVK